MTNIMHVFELNFYAVPLVVVGLLMFLTGLYIFLHNKHSRANFSFFLICLCGLFWFFGNAATYSARTPEAALAFYRAVTFLGVALIAPCVYYFSASWLNLFDKQKAGVRTALFLGAAFYIVGLFSPRSFPGVRHYFWGYYPVYGPLNYYFLGYFYLVLANAFYNFFRAYFKEPRGVRRTQIRLITLSFVVAFFSSLDYLPKLLSYPVYPLGFLLVFLWILIVAYAIIKYRAMDIETVVHKTLMWLATSAVAVVPFLAVIYGFEKIRNPSSNLLSTLYYFTVSIAFYFYFRAIQPRLDHWFQRRRTNLLAILEQFSKELVHLKNLRDLLQNFARMLRNKLFVRRLSVYLLDEKKGEFVPAIAKGLRSLKPFPKGHPFFSWLEKTDAVVVGELVLADPSVETFKKELEDYFQATQSFLSVPFVLGGKLIALANLGKKANLRRYGFEEVQFFAKLKAPLTIAFSNSMQFENISELYNQVRKMSEELKQWNIELEQRVEDRTRELVKTQDQLVQAEKLATLGTLAGGVAHEINNPLTAVLTNAQILKMTADEDVRESLDLIEEGAKRCQQIVQKLMKYARKTAEEAPHKEVDLNEVVQGTCALLGFQFQQENIEIETKLGQIRRVMGIGNELEQVLTNLLVNARDAIKSNPQSKDLKVNGTSPGNLQSEEDRCQGKSHSPSKDLKVNGTSPGNLQSEEDRCQGKSARSQGRIVVETRGKGAMVELVVTDNGIGIPKGNLKKIFDPFFTTKEVGSGTGLGLAVSYGILKRHNASVSVDSSPGKGTTFVLCFPRKQQGES